MQLGDIPAGHVTTPVVEHTAYGPVCAVNNRPAPVYVAKITPVRTRERKATPVIERKKCMNYGAEEAADEDAGHVLISQPHTPFVPRRHRPVGPLVCVLPGHVTVGMLGTGPQSAVEHADAADENAGHVLISQPHTPLVPRRHRPVGPRWLMPSGHITVGRLGTGPQSAVEHVDAAAEDDEFVTPQKIASNWQALSHPSPLFVFPSSHCSPASSAWLPQVPTHIKHVPWLVCWHAAAGLCA